MQCIREYAIVHVLEGYRCLPNLGDRLELHRSGIAMVPHLPIPWMRNRGNASQIGISEAEACILQIPVILDVADDGLAHILFFTSRTLAFRTPSRCTA